MSERRQRLKQAFPQSPRTPFRLREKFDNLSSGAGFAAAAVICLETVTSQ
jgi:hypothetical protein